MTTTAKVDGKTCTSWLGPTAGPQGRDRAGERPRWGGVGRKPGRAHGQGVSDWLSFICEYRRPELQGRSGVLTWETGPSLGQYLPGFSALAGGRGLVGDPVRRARDGWVGEAVVSGCLPEEPRAVLNPRLLRQKGRLRRVLYLESVQNCGERLRLSFSFGHPHQLPS